MGSDPSPGPAPARRQLRSAHFLRAPRRRGTAATRPALRPRLEDEVPAARLPRGGKPGPVRSAREAPGQRTPRSRRPRPPARPATDTLWLPGRMSAPATRQREPVGGFISVGWGGGRWRALALARPGAAFSRSRGAARCRRSGGGWSRAVSGSGRAGR